MDSFYVRTYAWYGDTSIHKEIHGMAPKCSVAAGFWNFRRTNGFEIGSVKGVVSRSMYDGPRLLQLLHMGEHLPKVLLYLKVFSSPNFLAIQEL